MDATVISRYAGMGGATASVAAEPQRDLLHHAKSGAPQAMADALAHTPIGSDARLSADGFHFILPAESDPASRMGPACGSDWPHLTSKSSDIEGTGRHLWRLLERNA